MSLKDSWSFRERWWTPVGILVKLVWRFQTSQTGIGSRKVETRQPNTVFKAQDVGTIFSKPFPWRDKPWFHLSTIDIYKPSNRVFRKTGSENWFQTKNTLRHVAVPRQTLSSALRHFLCDGTLHGRNRGGFLRRNHFPSLDAVWGQTNSEKGR